MDDKTRPDETGYRFIGKPMPRKEDERLDHRQGPLHRRFQSRRPGLCGDGALALPARAHRCDRLCAREANAGRARRLHRRRLRRRQARRHPARSGAENEIRHEAARARRRRGVHRTARAAAGRQGAPRRRSGGDGGRRDKGAGDGRRRGGRSRNTKSCHSCCTRKTRCGPARRAVWDEVPNNVTVDTVFRRRGERPSRRSRAQLTSSRRISTSAASPACRSSRAPRSATTTPRPGATRSTPARAARCARRARSRPSWASRPKACACCSHDVGGNFGTRNRVFVEFGAGAVGVAQARPAGEIHRDTLGSFPERLSGPRSGDEGRTGARCRSPLHRACARPTSAMSARAAYRCRRSARAPA